MEVELAVPSSALVSLDIFIVFLSSFCVPGCSSCLLNFQHSPKALPGRVFALRVVSVALTTLAG